MGENEFALTANKVCYGWKDQEKKGVLFAKFPITINMFYPHLKNLKTNNLP